jgi:molybdenum cofactor guanylyltransferase
MSAGNATPTANVPTLGVVLAGGRARRAGGGDKSRILVRGSSILERVISRVGTQCAGLILNANGNATRFADTHLVVVPDSVPHYAGPLAGILAGLDWATAHAPKTQWIVSVPSDCPFLPRNLVERLHQARIEAAADLACGESGGQRHPVIALWSVTLREDLRRALTIEGIRKVDEWAARYRVGIANWPTEPVDPFFNVNTPDDTAAAERVAARHADA